VLTLLAIHLAGCACWRRTRAGNLRGLETLPKQIENILAQNDALKKLAKKYAKAGDFFFSGAVARFPSRWKAP